MNKSIMLFCALFVSISSNAADNFERHCLSGDSLKMHRAASEGDLDTIKGLIETQGVECADRTGTTLLMIASRTGQLEVVQFLIENDADINAQTKAGWTALHYAAGWKVSECVDLLLKCGADKTLMNSLAETPERTAHMRGYVDVSDKIASYSRMKSAAKTE